MAGSAKFDLESKPGPPRPVAALVAPDPLLQNDGVGHFNTLVVRPEYKLQLRLGDIDDLFPTTADDNTDLNTKGPFTGRKARLQVAGFGPRPLADTFIKAADAVAKEKAHKVPFDYFKKLKKTILDATPAAGRAAKATELLLAEMQQHVVEGGKLPPATGAGKMVKIRVPGGWPNTFPDDFDLPNFPDPFQVERQALTDNTVLCKIPIIAHVLKRKNSGEKFVDAPGVMVYLQLIKPDDLPAPGSGGVARAVLRSSRQLPLPAQPSNSGPDAFMKKRKENFPPKDATDVQVDNAHSSLGGKRSLPVAGNLFEINEVAGFNKAHPSRPLPHLPFNKPEKAPDKFKNAVRATTNDDGECGVIFMPSQIGGDRYKVRAFIGPPTFESDGTEADAIVVDTGTMVRWRTIRLARFIQHTTPAVAALNPIIRTQVNNVGDYGPASWNREGAVGTPDFAGHVTKEYSKAFLEFKIDPPAAELPETRDGLADLAAAHTAAVAFVKTRNATFGIPYDTDKLFYLAKNSPFTVNMHTPRAYNGTVAAPRRISETITKNAAGVVTARRLNGGHAGFLSSATQSYLGAFAKAIGGNGGFLPGMIVIQGPLGDTMTGIFGAAHRGNADNTTSGIAVGPCAFVWYGANTYLPANFPYGLSNNTTHEMGHDYNRAHQPDHPGIPNPSGVGGAVAAQHDSTDTCVMSYMNCEGEYCGHCIGAFMGMDAAGAAFISAV